MFIESVAELNSNGASFRSASEALNDLVEGHNKRSTVIDRDQSLVFFKYQISDLQLR